ncbi:hypothetical protein Forpe1208_v016346 [Fusarium oxysporum f. sp. rapae]|uniref:Uncharacterized protein n=1 Tax=Fusarium oxysporum f. sp. rapae TaxID=485398 RepID=A0A8J5NPE9_FUSOX|nr:hypothetical protein Forpe1208_v016346 [Fusarium oxysporum f. sp. rapae]
MFASRPASRYLTVAAWTLLLLTFYQFSLLTTSDYRIPGSPFASKEVKVSVIESKGCHDEVSASYLSALGQLSECNSNVFLAAQRFGIDSIYKLIPGADNRKLVTDNEFRPQYFQSEIATEPDIVLSVTSEYDLIDAKLKPTFAHLLHNASSILFATVHHGNEWTEDRRFEAKDRIKFHRGLPYPEFYEVLHSATAMLPAFASHEYVESKASSTIAASLIVGSPLIADDALLNAYRFLRRDDVYYREKGEDEIDVVERIAKLPEQDRLAKTEGLRKKNELLTKQGGDLLRQWISESQERRGG